MSVIITSLDVTATGTVTAATLAVTNPVSFSGLAWTPATTSAVQVNGIGFAFPLSVVRLTFTQSSITALDVNGKSLTALTGLSSLTALATLDCSSNSLAALDVSGNDLLTNLDASANALTETEVNNILIALDGFGLSSGTVDLSGGTNSAPSGAGSTAATNLTGKSWSVTTN